MIIKNEIILKYIQYSTNVIGVKSLISPHFCINTCHLYNPSSMLPSKLSNYTFKYI